eukprot:CAMPEP_0172739532 /NCGR_PEP_ID=MMETSP1074-20121228/122776_1 /TAXON_ID=2916 /ORGANISM="Ceratium fusus, Strain PA161109" /LENGTH=71 /DNA_ID=CAMNT_0013569429 /DNA_START=496 /DNA_END=711 /DNA_ORIENTATION=-
MSLSKPAVAPQALLATSARPPLCWAAHPACAQPVCARQWERCAQRWLYCHAQPRQHQSLCGSPDSMQRAHV